MENSENKQVINFKIAHFSKYRDEISPQPPSLPPGSGMSPLSSVSMLYMLPAH